MDAVGRTFRWVHGKAKVVAVLLLVGLGGMLWYQAAEHSKVTWCPTLHPRSVTSGITTWESLAQSTHLPVRVLKMCNGQDPTSSSNKVVTTSEIWVPNFIVMFAYILLIWLALQSIEMPGLVSLMLLYVLLQVFIFGIDFSLCPGKTYVLKAGETLSTHSAEHIGGVVFCNLGLVGADFTQLPIGYAYRDPYSLWTGAVVVLLFLAVIEMFRKRG